MENEKPKALYIMLTAMFMCIALGTGTAIIGTKLAYTDLDTVTALVNILDSDMVTADGSNLIITREGINSICDFAMNEINDLHNTVILILKLSNAGIFICIAGSLFAWHGNRTKMAIKYFGGMSHER